MPMAYQTFTHQIWWVMVCYDLAHQIRWAKHTFSGWCDITPMVCCSFGGHSTPEFLQCTSPFSFTVNGFSVIIIIIVIKQFFRRVFSEYTEANATSLISQDAR